MNTFLYNSIMKINFKNNIDRLNAEIIKQLQVDKEYTLNAEIINNVETSEDGSKK